MTDYQVVFDLDGTLSPYKEPVPSHIANFINNNLGEIVIVTGGTSRYARAATRKIKKKRIIGVADYCPSIDLAKAFRVPKWLFNNIKYFQKVRLSIAQQLSNSLCSKQMLALTGGRSTIDIQTYDKTKAALVTKMCGDKKIIFFYDCKWSFLIPHSNDYPLVKIADLAVRTDYKNLINDVKSTLQALRTDKELLKK